MDTSVLHEMISAYTPVGINYNLDTYAACVQLAVLDYNENIGKLAKPGWYLPYYFTLLNSSRQSQLVCSGI